MSQKNSTTTPARSHFNDNSINTLKDVQKVLKIEDFAVKSNLCGTNNDNLVFLAGRTGTQIDTRKDGIVIKGKPDAVFRTHAELVKLLTVAQSRVEITKELIAAQLNPQQKGTSIVTPNKTIQARKPIQNDWINAIRDHDISFGVGPAGTGKTYVATMLASEALHRGTVDKIIISRPAVATEQLGYLPGDLKQKVDPYMQPIYDALNEAFGGPANVSKMIENKQIEILPLAFMRGRDLKRAFIVYDEMQNSTAEQMKMALTRMGEGSKIVVNGDPDQIDLPKNFRTGLREKSGLVDILELVTNNPKFGLVHFQATDIVRHPMVQELVTLYAQRQRATEAALEQQKPGPGKKPFPDLKQ